MQGVLVAQVLPADGQRMFLGTFQERRGHRRLHELPTNSIHLRHRSPSLLAGRGLQIEEQRRCKAAAAPL